MWRIIVINYTVESKSKSIHNDNYIPNVLEKNQTHCVTCWACIFCGKNVKIPVLKDKMLCAKYIDEVANVKGAGTCDSGRSRFNKLNFVNPIKKWMLEKTGFVFKNR